MKLSQRKLLPPNPVIKRLENIKGKKWTAVSYLKLQLCFLKKLIGELEENTKGYYMVDMQIANLERAIDEVNE